MWEADLDFMSVLMAEALQNDQLHWASSVLRLQTDIRERWWFECEICKPCSASCVLFLASGVPACGDTPGNSKEELAEMQADWQPVLLPPPCMLDVKDGVDPTAVCSASRLYWCFQRRCWTWPSVTSWLQWLHLEGRPELSELQHVVFIWVSKAEAIRH